MKEIAVASLIGVAGALSVLVPFTKPSTTPVLSDQAHIISITNPQTEAQMHFACAQILEN